MKRYLYYLVIFMRTAQVLVGAGGFGAMIYAKLNGIDLGAEVTGLIWVLLAEIPAEKAVKSLSIKKYKTQVQKYFESLHEVECDDNGTSLRD